MRKWLVLLVILAAILFGAVIWLSGVAKSAKPEPGERRIEIENVF